MKLKGKRIAITGGTAGIGFALAEECARRGADVAVIARREQGLRDAETELAAFGTDCFGVQADVTDSDAIRGALAEAKERLGGLDGVVANSGLCLPGLFHELDTAELDQQLDVNFKGAVYTAHAAIPLLLDGGGFIAFTSSPAGNAAVYGFSVYGATKAALNLLAHTLHHEYSPRGIRILNLQPPDTDTPGYQYEITRYPPETKAILSGGKLFTSEHVARAFADAIENNRRQVTVGFETQVLLRVVRWIPWLWEAYVRHCVRKARRTT